MTTYQKEIEALLYSYDKELNGKLYKAYVNAVREIKREIKPMMDNIENLNYPQRQLLIKNVSLQLQLEQQIDYLSGYVTDNTYKFLNQTGEIAYNELFYEFEQLNGFKTNFTMLPTKVIETIIQTPIEGLRFSERIQDGLVSELRNNFEEVLSNGFTKGYSYKKMAKQLSDVAMSSYKRGLTIARTEGGRVQSVTRQMSQNDALELGINVKKQWVSTLDGETRSSHRSLDGQVKEINDYFEVNGHKTLQPHMFGIPGEDINCRCRSITKLDGHDNQLRRDNEIGKVISYKNYDEWAKDKNINYKDENLSDREYNVVNEELRKKLEKDSDDWFNSLGTTGEESIKNYTGSFYKSMNYLLRNPPKEVGFLDGVTYSQIDDFSKALSKFKLDDDIVTYRGISQAEYNEILNNSVFKDFKSTSVREKVAKNFQEDRSEHKLVTFKIPKGTNGAYVGNHSMVALEKEFTLNYGTRYKVKETKEGLEVTIIGRE